jgi:hypothetical protein
MPPCHVICYRYVIPDGIFRETDLFFYRHSVSAGFIVPKR